MCNKKERRFAIKAKNASGAVSSFPTGRSVKVGRLPQKKIKEEEYRRHKKKLEAIAAKEQLQCAGR